MNLNQLQYFVAVVECGSYRAASKKLYLSPQALSKSVKELESELGIDLVKKEGRNLKFTQTSSEFYRKALSILEDVDQLQRISHRSEGLSKYGQEVSIALASRGVRGSVLDGSALKKLRKLLGTANIAVNHCPLETCMGLMRERVVKAVVLSRESAHLGSNPIFLGKAAIGWLAYRSNPLLSQGEVGVTDLKGVPVAFPYSMKDLYRSFMARFRLAGLIPLFEYIEPTLKAHVAFLQRGGIVPAYKNSSLVGDDCRFVRIDSSLEFHDACMVVVQEREAER